MTKFERIINHYDGEYGKSVFEVRIKKQKCRFIINNAYSINIVSGSSDVILKMDNSTSLIKMISK